MGPSIRANGAWVSCWMAHKDYSHRDVVDKLGIQLGYGVVFDDDTWPLDEALRRRVLDRADRLAVEPENTDDAVDVVLVTVDDTTDAVAVLQRWRSRVRPAGAVWLLSPKRGQRGYVDQRALIDAGPDARMVDNKSCSVSDTVSGIRFVIRRTDRV